MKAFQRHYRKELINGVVDKMWIPFFLAATLSTIRELVKDVVDVAGDSMQGLNTFPKKYGLPSTLLFLRFLSVFLCIIALMPFIQDIYGIIYCFFLIILVV